MGQHVTDLGLSVTAVGNAKKEIKKETRTELKKHAAIIHCSNALSLLQRKISNALLYHAYKELMLKEEHEITVKQLCRLIGYQGNNHSAIKDALKALISTVIEWNLTSDVTGTENWTASSIIASVSLEGPMCYYAYSPRMKQLLHTPSMFGKIDLVIQSHFRSSYGLALYENCIRYRGLPHTKWFEMDIFKKLMGVAPGVYDVFRDFKRRVLDKAIEEVNSYSDLVISPEFVREGRKVAKIRFLLKERAKKTRLGNQTMAEIERQPADPLKVSLMQEFGLSKEQVEQLLAEHSPEFIQEKVAVVQASRPYQAGKVQNMAGYLISAIKNNYQMPTVKQGGVVDIQEVKLEMELTELKRQAEEIRKQYQQYRETAIHEAIDQLDDERKAQFMDAFLCFAEPAISMILQLQRNKYTRETVFESPQMKALLRQFALRELDTLTLPALDEYVLTLDDEKRDQWQKLKSLDPDQAALRMVD